MIRNLEIDPGQVLMTMPRHKTILRVLLGSRWELAKEGT